MRNLRIIERLAHRNANRLDGQIKIYSPPTGVTIPSRQRALPDFEILTITAENLEDLLNEVGMLAQNLERTEELFREPV
jgi:hypothetical protein